MRKRLLRLAVFLVIIGLAVNLCCIVICASSWSSKKPKWKYINGSWYLYDPFFGKICTGWQKVGGVWYYLDGRTGAMKTGWVEDNGIWYYMNSSGAMQTGWKKLSGNWFYFSSSGAMKTGWQLLDGKWYLLDENGIMKTGWQQDEDTWYYLDSTGAMRTGWLGKDNKWYYLKSNGAMLTGLQWIGKDLCYFEDTGVLRSGKKPTSDSSLLVHINIPNYNQDVYGYPLGCEAVSLYMALRGLGYMNDMSIHEFINTMPIGETPYLGYMGNPRVGRDGENAGKRTSIYPEPLSVWGSNYATVEDLTGASTEKLAEELKAGHVILIYATGGWNEPKWKVFPWSINPRGEVTNNHCLSVVGVYDDGSFLVNDCGSKYCEYKVEKDTFEMVYNARKFAVSVH